MKGKKFAALALALGMSLSFAACGGSEKSTSTGAAGGTAATEIAPEAPKGTNGSWGNYTQILIPDGMKLVEGSQIDKADPDSLSLQKDGDSSEQLARITEYLTKPSFICRTIMANP